MPTGYEPTNFRYETSVPIELRIAWRKKDPAIERDAELFWNKEKLLAPTTSVAERLSDLCMAGYHDGKLVGLTTVRIRYVEFLTARLAMFRMAVARDYRKTFASGYLMHATHAFLIDWSQANVDAEQVMGMGTITQSEGRDKFSNTWPVYPSLNLVFIGWTANGEQMRVSWFPHARIPPHQPEFPPEGVDRGFE